MRKVSNPDKNKIYDVWHFCLDCQEPFTHSQASCNLHKGHSYLTFSTEKQEVELPTCPNPECGKVLYPPHPSERRFINSICWHCGIAYYDPSDGFDEDR